MAFRMRYLRSRYVHRLARLPATHILRRMQSAQNFFMDKLRKHVFPPTDVKPSNKANLLTAEMNQTYALTKLATGGFLDLTDTVGLPWFAIDPLIHPGLRKRLLQWILKKFPAADPPTCGRCLFARCTQSHVAECTNLLADVAPDVPPRFRPESLLAKPNPLLPRIVQELNEAIGSCLPHLRLY